MKIGIDVMGGDYAPNAILEGVKLALQAIEPETILVLVGKEDIIKAFFENNTPKNIEIVNATQVIEMGEHPTRALPQKPDSSISVGYKLLLSKQIDAFCSAGNTGAMMVAAMFTVQTIKGLSRPAIISYVPKLDGRTGIILDVGANTDCKPEHLQQFAEVGSIFCKNYFGMESPKVALLNLGEEAEKGNLQAQATHKLLAQNTKINFVGNIEGRDLFNEKADVIVCDGFTGNIVIKMAESYYEILHKKQIQDDFFDNFNFESIGGSPILGINGNVIIAHGISNAKTIKNVALMAQKVVKADIVNKTKESLGL
ncbi:MAG: phosphate acyltransferase PlsX [Bacteroidetes bacterium]|nr:MAG: phosphate acyltransferase PlsX [Bacteroidota bacterium]TAG86878.1 MAG: phosphate acyltransferase PlsX [Bacteroidota bacterium]